MTRHGWLAIPGVQTGDRTLKEQMHAVWPAVAECNGKTVLDIGSAEGLISIEFAKAGASRVLAIEREPEHVNMGRKLSAGWPIEFQLVNMNELVNEKPLSFDIVLCLSVIHKLDYPEAGLRFALKSCKSLLLLRSGFGSRNGIIHGKHSRRTCDVAAVMQSEGFALEKTKDGIPPHNESVQYWRRAKISA